MGTNFYWKTGVDHEDSDDPTIHIGKRSGGDLYCWDCDLILDERTIACPWCGQVAVEDEWLVSGPAAVELGFAEPRMQRATGVRRTSCFIWAQHPEKVGVICRDHSSDILVVDEYGREYTGHEFLRMLECNCPVQFTDSIGIAFS